MKRLVADLIINCAILYVVGWPYAILLMAGGKVSLWRDPS